MKWKVLIVLSLACVPSLCQVSLGVKGGIPLTNNFATGSITSIGFQDFYSSKTRRYIVGPSLEVHLPKGISLEFDALYRRLNYDATLNRVDFVTQAATAVSSWEFPLLAKYRLRGQLVRPFVDAGVSLQHLDGVTRFVRTVTFGPSVTTSGTESPAELLKRNNGGWNVGAGLDIHALVVHVEPEIRYTRWVSENFKGDALTSNRNELVFLVGIRF